MCSSGKCDISDAQRKESADLILDCLENAIPYILFKRMVYPRSKFQDVQKFGMPLVALLDPALQSYISTVLETAHEFNLKGILRRVALCIVRISTRDVLERWQFRILPTGRLSLSQSGENVEPAPSTNTTDHTNTTDQAHNEITQIIKQIGVSFFPPLEHECSFKLLLYTTKSASIPENWILTHPHCATEGSDEILQLRELNTPAYKIQSEVVFTDSV